MSIITAPRTGVTGSMLTSDVAGGNPVADAPFGHALVAAAERNDRIVGLTADLGKYTDIHIFGRRFPSRYFQLGMAEQNLIGVAAGLARTDFIPFATTYCVFATRRAYDFIALAVAFGRANVKIVAGLPGLTTGYGGTHQGIEDLALMRSIPNLVVIDPCDATEVSQATAAIAEYDGPVYMRLLRGQVPIVLDPLQYRFELGKAKLLRNGNDVAIISTGLMTARALEAADQLRNAGLHASVLHVSTIKPFDLEAVLSLVERVKCVVTAENHVITGGLGSAVADAMVDAGLQAHLRRIGIPDRFCESGSLPYLIKRYHMDANSITAAALSLMEEHENRTFRGHESLHDAGYGRTNGEQRSADVKADACIRPSNSEVKVPKDHAALSSGPAPRLRPEMRIERIETIRLPEHPATLWVRVLTSDGLTGLGETYYLPSAVEAIVHEHVAPMLLGESAFDRERHWQAWFSYASFFGYAGAEMRAMSAIDIALWDLAGQYLQQPLYNLMGGRCRDSIRVYNTCVNTPQYADQDGFIERPGELAESLLADGITQMKIWPWDRFAPQMQAALSTGPAGWSAVGPPGHDISAHEVRRGLWTIQEIRRAVGDRMEIAIEGHSRWSLNCALRIARAVEPYDVIWMEDIIQPNNVDDLVRMVNESRVPQCVSERLFTKHAFRDVLCRKAAHIVMPDLVWTGGLTEALKISALADAHQLPIAPHDCTGPVNVLACLHLCAAIPNAMVMEIVRGFCRGYYNELLTTAVPLRDGKAVLEFSAGLGATLRPEVLARQDIQVRVSSISTVRRLE
jgi:transketolase